MFWFARPVCSFPRPAPWLRPSLVTCAPFIIPRATMPQCDLVHTWGAQPLLPHKQNNSSIAARGLPCQHASLRPSWSSGLDLRFHQSFLQVGNGPMGLTNLGSKSFSAPTTTLTHIAKQTANRSSAARSRIQSKQNSRSKQETKDIQKIAGTLG